MSLESKKFDEIFIKLGNELLKPTTLCIFGGLPAVLLGQPTRRTQAIEVYHPRSTYDSGDLEQACARIGILYNPMEEISADATYIQIVRPGVVALPSEFETETLGHYGNLTVVMPAPAVLTAAKLVRASEHDVSDIVWWVQQRRLQMQQIELSIARLPNRRDRETATENLVLVRLIAGDEE